MLELAVYFIFSYSVNYYYFAIIDFYFSRHYYMKSLRMSKQEIKDEYKIWRRSSSKGQN